MSSKSYYLNYVNEAMIHQQVNSKTGKEFFNITTPWPASATGLGTFAVFPNQVVAAKRRTDGSIIEGVKNIRLGYETSKRQNILLSIATKLNKSGKPTEFETIEVPMKDLVDARNAEYKAYKAARATEVETEAAEG